jgi:5-methylcytosine-specific restriction endonuclease McrA
MKYVDQRRPKMRSFRGVIAMPMKRELYPKNWEEIALAVKNENNWTCAQCGKICRKPGERLALFCKRINEWRVVAKQPQSFMEAYADYPDRDSANCTRDNLIALCAHCHLKLGIKQHTQSRKTNQIEQQETAGQLNIFTL